MFCSKCGTQIDDSASFCFRCGSPVPQAAQNANAYQQPQYQQPVYQQPQYQQPQYQQPQYQQPQYQQPQYQQPVYQQPAPSVDYRNNHVDKFGVNIVYPDGRYNEIGDLYITASELIFRKKSKGVMVAFGFLGKALEEGEEKLRIPFADIANGHRTKIGLNTNVYQINLRNGQVYKICVNNPAKIASLAQRFG